MARPFRTPESFEFEDIARAKVAPLLKSRGFQIREDRRTKWGSATSQTIFATLPGAGDFGFRVRLCWRRDGRNKNETLYSAAQLTVRLVDGDWERTVTKAATRGQAEGITHNLFVQADRNGIIYALAVPSSDVWEIWRRQRDVSAILIQKGLAGRITKNHAENGDSPTVWLQDDRTNHTSQVADVIWKWPNTLDIVGMRSIDGPAHDDDALDDLDDIGVGQRIPSLVTKSIWKRDPKVREAVRSRAQGRCERAGCHECRSFPAFLDVHHILGIQESDQPWTCVALCPNCHREAHFSPNANELNEELLDFARQFKP
jgi:5-methylcytosine-specific restriction protein A